mmetsp:Transcript_11402/g.16729  ORF Transcript_11402/g.16729 Transcript_11402/m.16729 type:complete len:219 (+) Transcript_11402:1672-2328(+)
MIGELAGDWFGWSVSLSSDGSVVAVGALMGGGVNSVLSGHARVFEMSADRSKWVQRGDSIDGEVREDESGASVSMSADGDVVAIAGSLNDSNGLGSGHVRIFEWSGFSWIQKGKDLEGEAAGDNFGDPVVLSPDASIVAVGAWFNDATGEEDSGQVRVFEFLAGEWVQRGNDIDGESAGDWAGRSVAMSSDGSIVAVGAIYNDGNGEDAGQVRVFGLV